MDSVIKSTKQKYSIEKWRQLIAEREETGCSIEEFCASYKVSRSSYYKWLRIIRLEMCSTEEAMPEAVQASVDIVKVAVPSKAEPAVVTEQEPALLQSKNIVVHINGSAVEIPRGTDLMTIRNVLQALKSLCC